MTFSAQVVQVLIASPGDTPSARQVLRETIEEWNALNGRHTGVMLLPAMWERDATPEMGERAQGIINRQLVDTSDILVGLFWTRLGTPTSEAESGTVEEIERFITDGKPVILYFSSEPVVPESIDQAEYARLNEFRASVRERGLVDGYSDLNELRRKAMHALTNTIRERFETTLKAEPVEEAQTGPRANLIARIEREPTTSGSRERLVVENRGTGPADLLSFNFELTGSGSLPFIAAPEEPVGRLPAGGSIDFPIASAMGTSQFWDAIFSWQEGDNSFEARQTVSST